MISLTTFKSISSLVQHISTILDGHLSRSEEKLCASLNSACPVGKDDRIRVRKIRAFFLISISSSCFRVFVAKKSEKMKKNEKIVESVN